MAAITAITRKINVQRNIKKGFMVNKIFNHTTQRIVPFSILLYCQIKRFDKGTF